MQSSPFSYHFSLLGPNIFLGTLFSGPSACDLPSMPETKFHTHTNGRCPNLPPAAAAAAAAIYSYSSKCFYLNDPASQMSIAPVIVLVTGLPTCCSFISIAFRIDIYRDKYHNQTHFNVFGHGITM